MSPFSLATKLPAINKISVWIDLVVFVIFCNLPTPNMKSNTKFKMDARSVENWAISQIK